MALACLDNSCLLLPKTCVQARARWSARQLYLDACMCGTALFSHGRLVVLEPSLRDVGRWASATPWNARSRHVLRCRATGRVFRAQRFGVSAVRASHSVATREVVVRALLFDALFAAWGKAHALASAGPSGRMRTAAGPGHHDAPAVGSRSCARRPARPPVVVVLLATAGAGSLGRQVGARQPRDRQARAISTHSPGRHVLAQPLRAWGAHVRRKCFTRGDRTRTAAASAGERRRPAQDQDRPARFKFPDPALPSGPGRPTSIPGRRGRRGLGHIPSRDHPWGSVSCTGTGMREHERASHGM